VKTLRLSAVLAALILTASTASAAVMDFGNALGPSGGYTSLAYYQSVLGGQPMTAAQQAYSDQEDQLRQLGFLSELGGDSALGQMFYHIAYGIMPPSGLDLVSGGSGLGPSSTTPSDGAAGSSSGSDAGSSSGSDAGSSSGSDAGSSSDDGGSVFTTTPPGNTGVNGTEPAIAVPEASTWVLMLLGFGGLGYAGWRRSRKPLHFA
jgi:PEP-CTERM motif